MVLRFLFISANCTITVTWEYVAFQSFSTYSKETDASKLCDSMKEELLESITQREMECIQNKLQQVDTEKERSFVYKEKDK